MKNVEILAPAGSMESLKGAINGGCDAVYLGGSKFGARAFAENFDEESMLRAIDYVHLFDKKIYLTVNTLLQNQEIEEELFEYMEKYYREGIDAVIVQDPGVISFLHRNFPKLPLHASTQMTFNSEKGAKLLKEYGVERFVTGRELSIQEIKELRRYTDLEIETFVHGALCYCYSGQCFLSSMIGQRSGNRGRCAQPCRMPYEVSQWDGAKVNAKPYVLSPKDMCTLDKIPDLVDAGINSFKIEGRMKKPAYSAYTAYLYRKYVDLYLEYQDGYEAYLAKHKKELEYDYTCLMDLYNRGGFSGGYFYEHNGPRIMSMVRPNHSGVKIGTVSRMQKNRAYITLEEDIYAQDVLEFRGKDGKVLYEYTVKEDVPVSKKETQTNTKQGSNISVGTYVYRTRRNALLNEIQTNILEKKAKQSVDFYFYASVGQPMELTCVCGDVSITVSGEIVEMAKSQPMSEDKIQKQLSKLKDTNFDLEQCIVSLNGDTFIPVGQINELRRLAIAKLEEEICRKYKRTGTKKVLLEQKEADSEMNHSPKVTMVVSVNTVKQGEAAECEECVEAIYCDLGATREEEWLSFVEKSTKAIYLILPAILRRKDYTRYEKAMKECFKEQKNETVLSKLLGHEKVKGFVIKNYEAFYLYDCFASKEGQKECILDYNMYTFNREAKEFWREHGVEHSTASIELNGYEWKQNGCKEQDVIVYGHMALMTSAQCVCKNTKGCKQRTERLCMRDRSDKEYVSINRCEYCYNQIYDGLPLSLHEYMDEITALHPKHIRLDFVWENKEQMQKIIKYYYGLLHKGETFACPVEAYTTGHYKKGVK